MRAKARAYSAAHPDKVRARNAKWRAKNPERVKSDNASRDPEKVRQAAKKWREANPDRARASVAQYHAKNPQKIRIIRKRRRVREVVAPGTFTANDVRELYRRQKGKCLNCRVSLGGSYHLDHIIPLSKGGTHWPHNLQLLCAHCNVTKAAKDPIEWAQENGRLL